MGAVCILTRQHETIASGMHDLATNASAFFMMIAAITVAGIVVVYGVWRL